MTIGQGRPFHGLLLLIILSLFATSSSVTAEEWSNAPATVAENAEAHGDETAVSTTSEISAIGSKSLLHVMRDGGMMLVPIVICSFVLCIFIFERSISLRRGRVIPGPFVTRFLHQLEDGQLTQNDALDLCEENRSPVSEVFAAAIKKWNRPSVEVEQAVIDAGEREANGLRRYLRIFNGISTVCPLLGLLGTVIGMIQAFNTIATADAMGRPELLAGGIGQALLTTAAGLSVAIPAIIFYLYFIGRVDRLIIELDIIGQRVVNAIASDGWKEKPKPKRKAKTETKKAA